MSENKKIDAENFVLEYWHKDFTFGYKADEIIKEEDTEHFHLVLGKNKTFGKFLMLDGATQLTEKEVHVYHEMIVHAPILAHGNVEEVLIIGGGDGGAAREVIRHQNINVTQVEIDKSVVDFSVEFLPDISDGAFDSDRVNLIIGDGVEYVKNTDKKFDLIIIDSTDPVGPAKALFEFDFFNNCKNILKDGGILLNQAGLPYLQPDELRDVMNSFHKIFTSAKCFLATIPCYILGPMAFGWGTDNDTLNKISTEELKTRYETSGIKTKYYNPEVHKAVFAIPNEIKPLVEKSE